MSKITLKNKLVAIVIRLSTEKREEIERLKNSAKKMRDRPDLIWHLLLCSMSTLGNSRGYQGLILNKDNYHQVSYETLSQQSAKRRCQILQKILQVSKVRWPIRKAQWLDENYKIIKGMGGVVKSKELAFAQKGTKAKIQFMKQFHGIGSKYARNVWMDIYHPDFHECIAIDQRITKITNILNYNFSEYAEHEKFYLNIAREACLQGWELDRVLYQYNNEIIKELLKVKKRIRQITPHNQRS